MRKALTLDELRDMEGNPVLVEMKNEIEREHNGVYISLYDKQMKAIRLWGVDGAWLRFSEKDMKVYAYTDPPRLGRSAWEPCGACKTENIMIHVPAFKAMAVCNQHMDHGAFDLTLYLNFCPYCGRPLTDAAWDALENRLESAK